MRRNLRFTLIELLVVVSIIAILAAMLLPALAKAKLRVKGTKCVHNHKQLAMMIQLYMDDAEGFLPTGFAARGPTPVPCASVNRTFIMCKPDAVERGLVGEIVSRIERKGLRLVALELREVEVALAEAHYEIGRASCRERVSSPV